MHLLTETEIRTKSIPRTKQMKIEIFRMKYNKDKNMRFVIQAHTWTNPQKVLLKCDLAYAV